MNLVGLIKKGLGILSSQEKRRLTLTIPIFISLTVLDLIGIILLGTVTTLTFNIASSDSRPSRLELIIRDFSPYDFSQTSLISILAISAVLFLGFKTIFQGYFTYKLSKFMARLETRVASTLFEGIIDSELSEINSHSYSDYQSAISYGVSKYIGGILTATIMLISDSITTLAMAIFALYASPSSALIGISVFVFSYLIFNGPITKRAKNYGVIAFNSNKKINEDLLEILRGIREIKTYRIEESYKNSFKNEKYNYSLTNQKINWLNSLIKYFLEISILLSGTLIVLGLIITTDLRHAITLATVFLVIGFRLIPNIQRIQNSVNSLRSAEGYTAPMFNLLENLPKKKHKVTTDLAISKYNLQKIIVENLSFEFRNGYRVLNDISVEVLRNQTLVIMGDSGSGKSTLVDLILGLYVPTLGKISYLSDNKSEMSNKNFTISYISQSCSLFGSDLYENISLRKNLTKVERDKIDQIASGLNLDNFFVENNIREIRSDNTNVSGGERQRISIARAKFFDTEIVVLDEPTSALDEDNKKRVLGYLQEISHNKTVIIVTHSQDLLDIADLVLLLDKGQKMFYGSISEFKAFKNRNI